jgi:hypothetical protein
VLLLKRHYQDNTMITHTKQGRHIDSESVVAFRADLLLLLGIAGTDNLSHASVHGHLPAVRVLAEQYPLNVRAHKNASLRLACYHGRLPIVVYLSEHCQLTRADALVYNNVALQHASVNGHLPVVVYLVEHYGLTRADTEAARRIANGHGRWHTAEYLDKLA